MPRQPISRHSWTLILALCAALCLNAAAALSQIEPDPPSTWKIDRFSWKGSLKTPGADVHLTNLHGDIRVRDANSQDIEISALIQTDSRDSHKADIQVQNDEKGLGVVVRYVPKDGAPQTDSAETIGDLIRRVDLVLFLPTGARLHAETDRGLLEAKGLSSPIVGRTQFGDVRFSTTGPVQIETLHGTITGVFKTTDWDGPSSLTTLTADIRAELPRDADTAVDAVTSGTITTDYSIEIARSPQGFRKDARAVIGQGRHSLRLKSEKGALTLAESSF